MDTPIIPDAAIRVQRWPTERPFLYLNVVASGLLWVGFLSTSQSAAYIAFTIGVMMLLHLAMMAQLRGSAVRLGPEQFPELYARVEELARRMGLARTPEVYVMQQDGALNAFATRFLRAHAVVLLTDLLEACGENAAARDMIIGHELGHIRAGHLRLRWLLFPAAFMPFLGSALSRAREYTCDRYGLAAAGDRDGALLGLTVLAAGARYGQRVNHVAFARQRAEMRGGWMMVGEWLASHPPLSKRVVALAPELGADTVLATGGPLRLLRPAFACTMVIVVGLMVLSTWMPASRLAARTPTIPESPIEARQQVERDFQRLRTLLDADLATRGFLPWDGWDLDRRWSEAYRTDGPVDPFNGDYWYAYNRDGAFYRLASAGPDGETDTADDIVFDSRRAK
jgi:Zn-dependent protease with chaperone function